MKILIHRYSKEPKQTIGKFYLLNDNGSIIASWDSLELPWRNNKQRVSCIPTGKYKAKVGHISPRFGWSLWFQNVPGRSQILAHRGNTYKDILGCVIIGLTLKDIDGDGVMDVKKSVAAINQLRSLIPKGLKEIDIEIKN